MSGRPKRGKSEAEPSPKKGKRDSRPKRGRSNITAPEAPARPARTRPTPRARAKSTVLKAHAIERLAAGEGKGALAAELGVDPKTLHRWAKEAGVAERAALTMEQAAERGRKVLIESVERAARRVRELVDQVIVDKGEASGARVNLHAALAVLDRAGLHPKQGVELGENTLTALFDRFASEPHADPEA